MNEEKRGHYCVDCPLEVEHTLKELCPSCGRCEEHCRGDQHEHMQRREAAQ